MKRIATLLCLAHLFTSPLTVASEKRLISWKVASVGNHIITNYDVEQFIEETQISDSLKINLFKKAEKNYAKYLDLKRETTKKHFKEATGKLVYTYMMKQDHQRKHYKKRVAFTVTTSDYNDAVQENEHTILKDLLDQRMGIVKAREIFGNYLIEKNYPHMADESPTTVYMRWYKSQSSRIETEFLLKEVKRYESYVALRNEQYYPNNFMDFQDKYEALKAEVSKSLQNKKISHKILLGQLNKNNDWKIVIKDVDNTQVDTTYLKDYSKSPVLEKRAQEILSNISTRDWTKATSYHSKVTGLVGDKYSLDALKKMSKEYTETYIKNKSNYSSYMSGLIVKLAIETKLNSSFEDMSNSADRINNQLREGLIQVIENLSSLTSNNTLEKEVANTLEESVNYSTLSDLDKAIANLSIFSIKFQIKKQSFENVIPVRVEFEEYTSMKTYDGIRNLLKYNWMKEEFKDYVKNELFYNIEYMTIRTGEHEYLNPEEKINLILGEDFQ